MEKVENKNYNKNIFSTFFRCKQCLTIQKIVKIILPRYFRPMTSIYFFVTCQNEHFEKYKLKNISELSKFTINDIKCSSCKISPPIYYCLTCYKTFCLKCKDDHSKKFHNKIIELQNIDNICPKHFTDKVDNKFHPFYICEECYKDQYIDASESNLNKKKGELDDIIDKVKKDLNKLYKKYDNNEKYTNLIKNFEKRINEEINFIQKYYEQATKILKSKSKLNICIYNNLKAFEFRNPLKIIFSRGNLDEKDILHIFSLEHIFSSYYGHEKINLKINTLLKIKEEEKNHFEISPEKLEHNCSLYDFEFGEGSVFDVFTNKDKIPILVFSKSNTINFMNLINHKIEKCITIQVEKIDEYIFYIAQLKYYKYNGSEYILSLLKNGNNQTINIYDINNDFGIKFSISNKKEDNEIKNCFLFYYKNNTMLFLCLLKNVSIYDIHSKELITSIYKNKILSFDYYTFAEDYIYVNKNKSCYIIINSNEKMISLKYPKCVTYKEYPNYFQDFWVYTYPIFEFEDNKTYLFTIFNHDFLYIFDFHTAELIKEIDLITTPPEPVDAHEYIFWNSDILLIPDSHDGVGSVMVHLSSENVETVLGNCYQMKKIFLTDSQESIIIKGFATNLYIQSLKKYFLSEEEKKKYEEKKEKEIQDYYDDNFLNNINLSDDE